MTQFPPNWVTYQTDSPLFAQMVKTATKENALRVGDYVSLTFHHSKAFHRVTAVTPHGKLLKAEGVMQYMYDELQAPYTVACITQAKAYPVTPQEQLFVYYDIKNAF